MSDTVSEESLQAFLDHLAETSNVSVSAKRAGVSRSAVYRLRATSPAFSIGWQTAIATGHYGLEFRMLKTARFGTIKPVKRPDGSIEKTRGEAAADPLAAMPVAAMQRYIRGFPMARRRIWRIALVAANLAEARSVMVEGPSGLFAIAPGSLRPV